MRDSSTAIEMHWLRRTWAQKFRGSSGKGLRSHSREVARRDGDKERVY